MSILSLYAVRSKDGKFFKNIGYGGGGGKKSWVDSLDKAKIYAKIGQARSRVTFWEKNYPEYGRPDLIELVVEKINVIDDTEVIKKNKKKNLQNAIASSRRMVEYYEKQKYGDLNKTKLELEKLQNELKNYD